MTVDPLSIDRLCVHQVTLMQCDFRQSIECLARHGITKTAVWREKLQEIGVSEACRVLDDNGVEAISLCAGGFLTSVDRKAQAQALSDNRRWLDQAAAIGAASMVTITGGFAGGERGLAGARERAVDGLAELLPDARAAGVRIALEPLHPMVCGFRSVISTLAEANAILDRLDADDVMGIALDSYALWWDADLAPEIARAESRIINFHVSDWLTDTRDIRLDRGMPGDGVIENRQVRSWLEETGFSGPVEVEIFSEHNWWQRDPDEVVGMIVARSKTEL